MKRSKALIIFNEESEKRDKLNIILNTFYRMNMTLAVLVNKPANEIQDAIVELTDMDEDEILDIIFVIHAKQVNETQFSTVDGKILDLHRNILNYLFEVQGFNYKQKIIIFNASGHENEADLVPYNPKTEFNPTTYGLNCYRVQSEAEKFIESIFKELGRHRNLSLAIQNHKDLVKKQSSTISKDIKLDVPPSSCEPTSEFHEFVIG